MNKVTERGAGIDIAELQKFESFNAELCIWRAWPLAKGCKHVVTRSARSYWKRLYPALEDSGFKVIVARGEDIKARHRHKTAWYHCQSLAALFRHGMVRTNFIAPRAIRDLTLRSFEEYRLRNHQHTMLYLSLQQTSSFELMQSVPGVRVSPGKTTLVERTWGGRVNKGPPSQETLSQTLCKRAKICADLQSLMLWLLLFSGPWPPGSCAGWADLAHLCQTNLSHDPIR